MPELTEVNVFRTDINTPYKMRVRDDRYRAFLVMASTYVRPMPERDDWAMGFSSMSVTGLSTIFPHIPSKFPIMDVFKFLQTSGSVNLAQVEIMLEVFARIFPQINGAGEDVE